MEYTLKRIFVLLMLIAGLLTVGLAMTSTPSLSLGQAAYAGEDDGCDDDDDCDNGGSPAGGVNTGGGGTAEASESGVPVAAIALGGLGALAGGTLLLRRFARQDA